MWSWGEHIVLVLFCLVQSLVPPVDLKMCIYFVVLFSLFQGSLQIFTGLGLILGPPIGGWMYQAAGYELPFLVLGCILLLMVPFNMIVMPSCGRRSAV